MEECLRERLYLAKSFLPSKDGKNDIYVEKCPYVPHQLDGIRFLYKAYTKKKPGVILNDPSGYGKRVQTALFLSAVLPTLDKPVLILCEEGREPLWLDHFLKWTQVSYDVSVELTNPFIKKKVLVTPSYNAAAFARRDWSVIIVDDWLSKDLLKATLRAGLRVWITSTNVKEDLLLYSTFHSWIYPKGKFCAENFIPKDLRDVIEKKIRLDAVLEDTVLRRTNSNTSPPFTSTQVPIQVVETEPKTKVSKKNKDATGTKIKRTKRKSVDTENTDLHKNNDRQEESKRTKRKSVDTENTDLNKNNDRVEESKRTKRKSVDTENTDLNKNNDREEKSKTVEENSEGFRTGVNDGDFTQLKYKRNNKIRVLWDSDSEDATKLPENNKINCHKIPHEVKNDNEFSEDLFSADLSIKNTDNEIIENAQDVEVNNKTASEREIEKTEPDNSTLGSFELKLKQLEELTSKKFKGTFFDSII